MKYFLYLFILAGTVLIYACEEDDCPGFKNEPMLDIISNMPYDSVYAYKDNGDRVTAYNYGSCDNNHPSLPIDFHHNTFTFYLKNAWKTDTITLSYRIDAKYYGEDCGHRFMMQDMKVEKSSLPVYGISYEFCPGRSFYFKLQL